MTPAINELLQGYQRGIYTRSETVQYVIAGTLNVDLDRFWAWLPLWLKTDIRSRLEAGEDGRPGEELVWIHHEPEPLKQAWSRVWRWWANLRCPGLDRARIPVDFNEMVERDLVLLARTRLRTDSAGESVSLRAGERVFIFTNDINDKGKFDPLIATGIVEEDTGDHSWSGHVRWRCRIDGAGIRPLSEAGVQRAPV